LLVLAGCAGSDDGAAPPDDPATTARTAPAPAPTEPVAPATTVTVAPSTTTEPPATTVGERQPAATRELDCAEQLPTYVESAIPDGVTNPRLSCWAMEVPEDHADPDGRTIEVTYYVWESAAPVDQRPADPVFYAPGGPRGSAFNSLRIFANRDIQGSRDLVLMDTRGNGPRPGDELGLPLSGCPEVYASVIEVMSVNLPIEQEYAINESAWQACADRLRGEGWDLAQYQSIAVAEDLEQLRIALGHEQVNFYGESYSTLYGLQWMRAHPTSLRSVVLDSVTPTDSSWTPEALVTPSIEVWEWVVEQCEATPACNDSNPDLPGALERAVATLDADPHEIDIVSNVTGETTTLSLDGSDLMFIIDGGLSPSTITLLPGAVTAWSRGDFSILEVYAEELQNSAAGGLMTSGAVACHDSIARMDGLDDLLAVDPPWRHVGYLPNMTCSAVDVPVADAAFHAPVESDIPTLIVIGELDTATPAAGSRRVAETLTAATVVSFTWEGHVPVRSNDCATSIVTSFYDDPLAADVSCVETANATPIEFGA
jgi:pimeloyl-ACP methyl ester carboxylesterase